MPSSPFKSAFLASVALSGTLLWTGCQSWAGSQRVEPGSARTQSGVTKTVPSTTVEPLPVTALSDSQIESDVQTVSKLIHGHGGDGITRGPDQLDYNVDVRIDPAKKEYAGHLTVHFRNNLGSPMSTVYFNVWPDAPHFRQLGGVQLVSQVTVGQAPVHYTLNGTLLQVSLPSPLAAGASTSVSLEFQTKMPTTQDRYGASGTMMTFGNWFPILAVHDQYGWVTPPYYEDGESFYSLTGAFHLHVTAPRTYVLAISGEQNAEHVNSDGTVTHDVTATGVRDVAMVGDSQYKVLTGYAGGTEVDTYYTPTVASQAQLMESTDIQSVEYYDTHYGKYPYKTLRICSMQGWFGGMEYPQLVMISFMSGENSAATTKTDVAHEIAHQWFFSMVGDDEYLTPWVDESFATFSEMRFNHELPTLAQNPPTPAHVSYAVSAFPSSDFPSDSSSNIGSGDYYASVYLKGAALLNDLMSLMGPTQFDDMMRSYFNQYQYRVATTADFMNAVSAAMHKDMTQFFVTHGVDKGDDLHSPIQSWVRAESKENQRDWH